MECTASFYEEFRGYERNLLELSGDKNGPGFWWEEDYGERRYHYVDGNSNQKTYRHVNY